jgi:hypothetical protein
MKFPFRSRYSAWKRRRAVRALSRIDRKCLKMRKSLLFSSSHFDHVQSIAPTAGGKTSYLSFLSGNKLGNPIRNYLPTSPGSTFELSGTWGQPMGRYSKSWDEIMYPKQYYGKEKPVTTIYRNLKGELHDEYGRPVEIKVAKPIAPIKLRTIFGYDEDAAMLWYADRVTLVGRGDAETWMSTSRAQNGMIYHIDLHDVLRFHLGAKYPDNATTFEIRGVSLDGNRSKCVFVSNLQPGNIADLAETELTKNG